MVGSRNKTSLPGGKRLSLMDFGAGRGETVDVLVRAGVAAVGLDGNHIVRRTLPGRGVVADLAAPLDLAAVQGVFQPYVFDGAGVRRPSPRCSFERRSFKAAPPPPSLMRLGRKGDQLIVGLLEYLCCEVAFCRGFDPATGDLFSGSPEPGQGVELYVRTTDPPGIEQANPGEANANRRRSNRSSLLRSEVWQFP